MRKFNIKVNGVAYDVEVEEVGIGDAQQSYVAPVVPVSAPVAAPAPKTTPVAPKAPANGTELKAPMPGTIVGFKANNGDSVKKGQAVIILEAMKMENEIASPADGTITIVATKGATVNTGDVLAIIA